MGQSRIGLYRDRTAGAIRRLADAVADPPPPEDLRRRVGGDWNVIGPMQLDFLVGQGMKPHHAMVDVGCGTLRAGIHCVRYLDDGNYYGIDLADEMLEGGRRELAAAGLEERRCTLRATDTFEVDFGRPFDYALAQSVFTHISLNSIVLCLTNVSEQLTVGGRFFATFFRGPNGPERRTPLRQPAHEGSWSATTYCDRNVFHYSVEDFAFAIQGLPMTLDDLGDWGQPRGQQMLQFTRT